MTEHGRYDLALDLGGRLLRVQCKWARKCGDVVKIGLATSRHTPVGGYKRTTYSKDEIDAVAAYCGELDRCYFFPIEEIANRRSIYLRLEPAKNGQLAAVNSAADNEFDGAVAQLARAFGWQPKGQGFESPQLHNDGSGIEEVGAERFGRFTARFLQRAAEGEELLISRRGWPMARLCPVDYGVPPG